MSGQSVDKFVWMAAGSATEWSDRTKSRGNPVTALRSVPGYHCRRGRLRRRQNRL